MPLKNGGLDEPGYQTLPKSSHLLRWFKGSTGNERFLTTGNEGFFNVVHGNPLDFPCVFHVLFPLTPPSMNRFMLPVSIEAAVYGVFAGGLNHCHDRCRAPGMQISL